MIFGNKMNKNSFEKLFLGKKVSLIKLIIGVSVILFMTNLNAIVDLFQHPEIPYFDSEHLIVGSITFLFSLLLLFLLNLYLNRLTKTYKIKTQLVYELEIEKEKLKDSEAKLKELNAAKDKIFSIIAHDLRSPFNNILGFSDLLINSVSCQDNEKTLKYSTIINSTAKNTLVLLDDLLVWEKSQTGQIKLKPEKLILSPIIQEIIVASNSIVTIKNISLNFIQLDDIEVYADLNMLKTVLRNLISNAIKFTNPNGKVDIYAVQNQGQIEITVSDNGIGMNEETKNKLFRIETTYTKIGTANEKGSGLGLILCKEFVEKLGGKIWVESEEGKGSDFKFTLPLNKSIIRKLSSINKNSI